MPEATGNRPGETDTPPETGPPSVTGAPGSPPGYQWVCGWPQSPGTERIPAICAALLLITGVGLVGYGAAGGGVLTLPGAVLPLAGMVLAVGWAVATPSVFRWHMSRPLVSGHDDHTVVLHARVWNAHHNLLGGLLAFGLFVTWAGIAIDDEAVLIHGAALTVLLAVCFPFLFTMAGSRLQLSATGIRFVTARCDWEFPWAAIDYIGPDDVSVNHRFPFPAVALFCRRTDVVVRPPHSEGFVASDWRPRGKADGPWRIVTWIWGVDESALLSVLLHLREHPEHCATLTAAQLTAMLTPPPYEMRWAASRQLDGRRIPPAPPARRATDNPTRPRSNTRNRSRSRARTIGMALVAGAAAAAVLRARR